MMGLWMTWTYASGFLKCLFLALVSHINYHKLSWVVFFFFSFATLTEKKKYACNLCDVPLSL